RRPLPLPAMATADARHTLRLRLAAHTPQICRNFGKVIECPAGAEPPAGPSQSDEITVKLKATIIVAGMLAATAAHAETIDLKCWARGLTGGQRNSVYINGEQVTVNLDEGTMHSRTFGSNLAVHV